MSFFVEKAFLPSESLLLTGEGVSEADG